MKIRTGRTKSILESSIESALLAVEIYNKPRTAFKKEAYASLMVIAWTKLFHAHFNQKIGNKYYFKKGNKYDKEDGERKAWDLRKCIIEYDKTGEKPLSDALKANLTFFVKLRNKIEHRFVSKSEIETLIFGECQSLLYNYEKMLVYLFGEDYAINENLAFSLQFSRVRTSEQEMANKKALSREVADLRRFVEDYRTSLPQEVFDSQEYSIKLIQIPKISNTNRSDLAVEFVRFDELSDKDKGRYTKLTALIKDKVLTKEAVNVGKLRPMEIVRRVNMKVKDFNRADLIAFNHVFSIKPSRLDNKDKFDTNSSYCLYDEAHSDYVYTENFVELLIKLYSSRKVDRDQVRELYKKRDRLDLKELDS